MAKTFNIEIWDKLKEDFLSGAVFFGKAPEDTPAPYCVIHVLDSGDDDQTKTLCKTDGMSDLQFNIYGFNCMQIDELLKELEVTLKTYKNLEGFRVISVRRESTKGASDFSAEVGMGCSRFEFLFEKL